MGQPIPTCVNLVMQLVKHAQVPTSITVNYVSLVTNSTTLLVHSLAPLAMATLMMF